MLACGWLVGFAPLLVRNLAVGSPPLATSSRLAVNLAYANMPEAAGGGAYFAAPGPQLARIMDASGGSYTAGTREVFVVNDFAWLWLITHYDATGQVVWTAEYDHTGRVPNAFAADLALTSTGDVIVAGQFSVDVHVVSYRQP